MKRDEAAMFVAAKGVFVITKRVALRIVRVIPSVLLIVSIFFFSQQNAAQSSALSLKVSRFLLVNFSFVLAPGYHDLTPEQQNRLVANYNGEVREMAHGGIFFLLSVAIFLAIKSKRSRRIDRRMLIAYFLTFLFAVCDEVHQLFISGRSFQLLDILVDMGGAGLGVALCGVLSQFRYKNMKRGE